MGPRVMVQAHSHGGRAREVAVEGVKSSELVVQCFEVERTRLD